MTNVTSRTLTVRSIAIPDFMGAPSLAPVSLRGSEQLNRLFQYQLIVRTPDALNFMPHQGANFPLASLLGATLTVGIELENVHGNTDAVREITGLIAEARFLREEGRQALYELTLRLIESYPKRDYRTQWQETDFQFIGRLCKEWGIVFFFIHAEGKHRLVLADAMSAYDANPGEAFRELSFHPPGHRIDEPCIHAFVQGRALTSSSYVTTDYDYTQPRAELLRKQHVPSPLAPSEGEVFDWHSDSHFAQPKAGPQQRPNDPWTEGSQLALLRMEALRTPGVFAQGSGHLRGMVPGHTKEQCRPARCIPRPRTHGPQTAIVVGPDGKNVWTDDLGRIKVQFPWDRRGTRDADSSCWVRVVSPWAGNQLGATHVPRIGQEVIIDFLGGNPDLPICIGRVHNQLNLPSWQLPDQYAISGFRSRELTNNGGNSAAGRSNHLLLDDTEAKIQTQLASDHDASQLNLGHITRVEKNIGRQDYRGHGFELRTDGHGALRAGSGLFITTEKRTGGSAHVLASAEVVQRLKTARDQHDTLAETAREAGAQDANDDQSDVAQDLRRQNEQIEGKQPLAGSAGEGFPEFAAAHLVVASPAGIETSSAGSTHIASGAHVAITSGRHASISAGGNLLASVKGAIRLFAHRAGIRLISAIADIDIKALQQSINLLAKLDVTVTAERITITAKEEVLINGGGSYSKWTAGRIEHGSTAGVQYHVASYGLLGPRNKALPELPAAPLRKDALAVALGSFPQQGTPFANEPYALYKGDALVARGVTDAGGRVIVDDHVSGTTAYKVKLNNGTEFDLAVRPKLDPRSPEQQLSNAGFRGGAGKASRTGDYPSTT